MLTNLPWLESRKRIIGLVILDALIYIFVVNKLFLIEGYSLLFSKLIIIFLFGLWFITSYIVGRYTDPNLKIIFFILRQLTLTLVSLIFLFFVIIAFLLIFNNQDLSQLRLFLLRFSIFGFLSATFISLINIFIKPRKLKEKIWLFVGSPDDFLILKKLSELKRLEHQLSFWDAENDFDRVNLDSTLGVIVFDPKKIGKLLNKQLQELKEKGTAVVNKMTWCERVLQRYPTELLEGVDLLEGHFFQKNTFIEKRIKRLGDVLVSSILIIFTLPIVIICGLLVFLQDGGPIFYSQIRNGEMNKKIKLWKIRTMLKTAESNSAVWAVKNDPRITKIGAILRKTRLDELPQLLSVLSGEMSLIGPRPERPEFDITLEREISNYSLRRLIKPGLSGWAQVNYPYGASKKDSSNKLSYDLYYLHNFSFWLDLLILFKTMRLVLNAKGSIPTSTL